MSKSILSNKSDNSEEIQPPALPPKPPRFRGRIYKEKDTIEYLMPKIVSDSSLSPTLSLNYTNNLLPFPLNENEEKQKHKEQQEYLFISNKKDFENEDKEKEENIKEENDDDENKSDEFLRPPSICIEQNNLQKIIKEVKFCKSIENEGAKEELKIINSRIKSDLVECSHSTMEDCSETRALLDGDKLYNK